MGPARPIRNIYDLWGVYPFDFKRDCPPNCDHAVVDRRCGVGWMLFRVGVLTFIASQAVHISLLMALNRLILYQLPPNHVSYSGIFFDAVILGLLPGLCEETASLVGYRVLKERAKTSEQL